MLGFLPAVYEKKAHDDMRNDFRRAEGVIHFELKALRENMNELFKTKLYLNQGLNKVKMMAT